VAPLNFEVRVWDIARGQEVLSLPVRGSNLTGLIWSQDGRRLAVPCDEGIRILEMLTGHEVLTVRGDDALRLISWSPDGQRLAFLHPEHGAHRVWGDPERGVIKIWDAVTAQASLTYPGPRGQECDWPMFFPHTAFSPDRKRVATASGGHNVVWDVDTAQQLLGLPGNGPNKGRCAPAWTADGRLLAITENFRTVKVWDVDTAKEKARLEVTQELVWSLAWHPDGKRLSLLAAQDLIVWAPEEDRVVRTISTGDKDFFGMEMLWSPDGRYLAVSGHRSKEKEGVARPESLPEVRVWDAANGAHVFSRTYDYPAGLFRLGTFSPDGKQLAGLVGDSIRLLELSTGREVRITAEPFRDLAWSPDGKRLAGVLGSRLALWDTVTGHEVLSMQAPALLHSVAWSLDGKQLMAVTAAGEVIVWDTAKRDSSWAARSLAHHNDRLARFLSASQDGGVSGPSQAVAAARRATELRPECGEHWNTLGLAQYRAGNWAGAAAALAKAMQLRRGGDSYDWFYVAMACWQRGEARQARTWYDKAVTWMEEYRPRDEELKHMRAEAARLIGVPEISPASGAAHQEP
jgi:WD40 repeat protein